MTDLSLPLKHIICHLVTGTCRSYVFTFMKLVFSQPFGGSSYAYSIFSILVTFFVNKEKKGVLHFGKDVK